jgi:hypothetical protein
VTQICLFIIILLFNDVDSTAGFTVHPTGNKDVHEEKEWDLRFSRR